MKVKGAEDVKRVTVYGPEMKKLPWVKDKDSTAE